MSGFDHIARAMGSGARQQAAEAFETAKSVEVSTQQTQDAITDLRAATDDVARVATGTGDKVAELAQDLAQHLSASIPRLFTTMRISPPPHVERIHSSGYAQTGSGCASYVSDGLATAELLAAHPRACLKGEGESHFRLLPSESGSISPDQFGYTGSGNAQPFIQAAIDYANAVGIERIELRAGTYDLWAPLRNPEESATTGSSGHYMVVRENLVIGGASRHRTTLRLLNSHGSSNDSITQFGMTYDPPLAGSGADLQSDWIGSGIVILPRTTMDFFKLENVELDGTRTYHAELPVEPQVNLTHKGFWAQDVTCTRIEMRNVDMRNFGGEIYCTAGNAKVTEEYFENVVLDGSPHCAWNPGTAAHSLCVNLQAGNAHQNLVTGGSGKIFVGGRFYDLKRAALMGGAAGGDNGADGAPHPAYPLRPGSGSAPYITFEGGFTMERCGEVVAGSYMRGQLRLIDTTLALDGFGKLVDVDLQLVAVIDRSDRTHALSIAGPPNAATTVAGTDVVVPPASNIKVDLTCDRTNLAYRANRSFDQAVLLHGGLYDANTITLTVRGDGACLPVTLRDSKPGFVWPRIVIADSFDDASGQRGMVQSFVAAEDSAMTLLPGTNEVRPAAKGPVMVSLNQTSTGFVDGQLATIVHGGSDAQIVCFPRVGHGMKLQQDRSLINQGDRLMLRWDDVHKVWAETGYNTSAQLSFFGQKTWTASTIVSNQKISMSVPVEGARVGDIVSAISFGAVDTTGLIARGEVTSDGTVTVGIYNSIADPIDLTGATMRVKVDNQWAALQARKAAPALSSLDLDPIDATTGELWNGTVVNNTASSTITAFCSDGTPLTVLDNIVSGTFANAGDKTIALTETLKNSPNSPRDTMVTVTVADPVATLGTLSVSPDSLTQGQAATIHIHGAKDGSTITLAGGSLPQGLTLNSAERTLTGTLTTAGSSNFTLRETLENSPNSPRDTILAFTTVAEPVFGYTLPDEFQRTAIASSPAITGTSYYVASDGDDNAAGTSADAAWQSMAKAVAQMPAMQPGDAILFRGGDTFEGHPKFREQGDAAIPMTIGSYGEGRARIRCVQADRGILVYDSSGIVIRDLILDGDNIGTDAIMIGNAGSRAQRERFVRVINVEMSNFIESGHGILLGGDSGDAGYDDVRISGCDIRNCGRAVLGYGPGSSADGAPVHTDVHFDNCFVDGNTRGGLVMGHVRDGSVTWTRSTNNGAASTDGPVGIWMYNCENVWFRHCVSDNNKTGNHVDGDGIDIDGGCRNCGIEYCYTFENQGCGYLVCSYENGPMYNNIVRNNISVNDNVSGQSYYGGITLYTPPSHDRLENAMIYGNTIINANPGVESMSGDVTNATATFANNLIISSTGKHLDFAGDASGLSFRKNQYWGPGSYYVGGDKYADFAAFRAGRSNTSIYADPQLPSTEPIALDHHDANALADAYAPVAPLAGIEPSIIGMVKPTYNAFGRLSSSPPAMGAGAITDVEMKAQLSALTLASISITVGQPSAIDIGGATPGSTIALAQGSLPAGLTLDSAARVITGTPNAIGTSSFTLRETLPDSVNSPSDTVLSMTIRAGSDNLVQNGTFDGLSPWQVTSNGTVATSDNVMSLTRSNSAPTVFQTLNLIAGESYRVIFDRRNAGGNSTTVQVAIKTGVSLGTTTIGVHPDNYAGSTWQNEASFEFKAEETNVIHLVAGSQAGTVQFRNIFVVPRATIAPPPTTTVVEQASAVGAPHGIEISGPDSPPNGNIEPAPHALKFEG
ncbi:putative Ig domain-containing protein [Croceicoccus hydrothermalis]|uniref:putative Ig domain-containing protein n=1 Tax=Croceicoccus hydrothermalis TaxID=2867964 RepID=UPI001EFAB1F4|nr:putative Ig domain-containing protein [Croceicoccus hydrothermalis]